MKRFISILLTIVMCISVATSILVPASAAYVENNSIVISNSEFADGKITYTIKVKNGIKKLSGLNLRALYDATVLAVDGCVYNDSDVSGIYTSGDVVGEVGVYAMAFATVQNTDITADTEMFTLTFKVVSEERPMASVNFQCVEFVTDNDIDDDVTKQDAPVSLGNHEFLTLEAPKVTAIDSVASSLKVSWSSVEGAASYDVYRRTDSTEWEKVTEVPVEGASEYIDTTIAQGVEYQYSVVANNESGSTDVTENDLRGMYFGTIENINAVSTYDGIDITWSSLVGALKYELSRTVAGEDNWSVIAMLDGESNCTYSDTDIESGVEYSYSVRAINGKYTASMDVPAPVQKYIGRATVAAINTPEGLQVEITAVNGAEDYTLSRSVGDGDYEVVSVISAEDFTDGYYTYIDTTVEDNIKYKYSVQAKAGEIQGGVAEISAAVTKLAAPTLNYVKNTDDGVEINFNKVNDAFAYQIYRKSSTDTEFRFLARTVSETFTDDEVDSGEMYTYTVSAMDSYGGIGAYDQSLVIRYLSTPKGLTTSCTPNGVQLNWSPVAGAAGYTVYRKTSASEYDFVAAVGDEEFLDDTAEKNVIYTYTIQASCDSYESAYNEAGVAGVDFGTINELSATVVDKGIALDWNSLIDGTTYYVYRKTENDTGFSKIATVTDASEYTDSLAPSGVLCTYKVDAEYVGCKTVMTASEASAKYLSAPVINAANAGLGVVRITISAVYGANSYVIERAVGEGNTEYAPLVTLPATQTEYFDTDGIVAGETYNYRVKAVADDVESGFVTDTLVKMIEPKLLKVTNEIAGVKFEWNPVADATGGYYVYRKAPGDKEWTPIGRKQNGVIQPVYATEYIDATVSSGDEYMYTVEANTPDGLTGFDHNGLSIRFLETPDLVSVKNTGKAVTFKWSDVSGASHYKVYRKLSGKSWKCIATVPATATKYVDKATSKSGSIASGKTYIYTVKAQYTSDGNTVLSSYDSALSEKGINKIIYLAPVAVKSVENVSSGVTVKWSKTAGASSYYVYRKKGNSSWQKVATAKGTSYTDKKAKASGTKYTYKVCAYKSGYKGDYGTERAITYLAMPALKTPVSAKKGITVKWGSVNGASGYYVYRKSGKTWVKIATVKGKKKVSYLDKSARKGKTYTYTVKAYNGKYVSAQNAKGKTIKDRY